MFVWLVSSDETALREFPLDDAWIHQVYARGLLRDGRPTYNEGAPEAGFSSLAWLLTQLPVALFARITSVSPVIAAKLVSLLFGVVAAAGLGEVAYTLSGQRRAGLATIALVMFSAGFAFSAASAMEVTLTTACLAWGFHALLANDARAPLRAGLWLGIAAAARLEVIPFVVIAATAAAVREGPARERASDAVRVVAPMGAIVAAWGLLDLALVGDPLPNTFHVKAGVPRLSNAFAYLWTHVILAEGAVATAILAILMALGVRALVRAADVRARRALIVIVATGVTLFAVTITRTVGENVEFYGTRYFLPFTPLGAPFVAVGLEELVRALDASVRVYALALFALLGARIPSLLGARTSYAGHCADIATLYTSPARRLSTLPPEAVIAVEGAGSSRYWGGHRVIDLLGLNDHRVAHLYRVPALSACVPLLDAPLALLVPADWVAALQQDYELALAARWDVAHWAALGGKRPQTTVLLFARPRPARVDACRARLQRVAP